MEVLAGKVLNYYRAIGVASIEVSGYLAVGTMIHVKGHTTDFEQRVESMEADHRQISEASTGQLVGIKVKDYVRKHDLVFREYENM